MSSQHDRIAKSIADKVGTEYNAGQGPDIKGAKSVIEVETTPDMFSQGIRQLQGFQKPRYLAVPDNLVDQAVERTTGLKVGVMDSKGNIQKPAQRPSSGKGKR